jgi:dolichyl-phosphate-mannose-protein mannosyltransferase
LVRHSYGIFEISVGSAIVVSILWGVSTIPVLAWLTRRTFGAGADATGAALAALTLPHIAFSRKALTDAPFLMAWLMAIGLGGQF